MNFIDKLMPHLIFAAAVLPTVLIAAAAAVSLLCADPSFALRAPAQAAAACRPWQNAAPQP